MDTLCRLGASLNEPEPRTGCPPLWTALRNQDYGTAQILVSHGCDLEAWTEEEGCRETLLHRAIQENDVKSAIFLIKR